MTTTLCLRTDRVLGTCWCDDCNPETRGVAEHRSHCGMCTGNIRIGDRIVKPAGEIRWQHEECAA